jgi:hypothetical protein
MQPQPPLDTSDPLLYQGSSAPALSKRPNPTNPGLRWHKGGSAFQRTMPKEKVRPLFGIQNERLRCYGVSIALASTSEEPTARRGEHDPPDSAPGHKPFRVSLFSVLFSARNVNSFAVYATNPGFPRGLFQSTQFTRIPVLFVRDPVCVFRVCGHAQPRESSFAATDERGNQQDRSVGPRTNHQWKTIRISRYSHRPGVVG